MKRVVDWRPLAVLALAGALLWPSQQPESAEPESPDVVVYVLDTLRPDRLGLGDSELQTSPWMRSVAERGVHFNAAYSTSSWTPPAIASMMTGQHPATHTVVAGLVPGREQGQRAVLDGGAPPIPKDTRTLQAHFRRNGYQTWGTSTNSLVGHKQGFQRGFDHFRMFTPADYDVYTGSRTPDPDAPTDWTMEHRGRSPATAEQVHEHLMDWKPQWEAVDKPLFLWVHLTDPHQPYHRRAPWFVDSDDPLQEMRNAYDSEVRYTDHWLQRMTQDLGFDEDTLIVIVSDHGDAFQEHGHFGHTGDTSLWREVNDAVFVMAGPGIQSGRSPNLPVSLVDMAPTLNSLAGLPRQPQQHEGVDLAPLLGESKDERVALRAQLKERAVYASRGAQIRRNDGDWMVVKKGWKYMEQKGEETPLLYDLKADPEEQRNLYGSGAAQQAELARLLKQHREGAVLRATDKNTEKVELDEATLEALRAMGYVD